MKCKLEPRIDNQISANTKSATCHCKLRVSVSLLCLVALLQKNWGMRKNWDMRKNLELFPVELLN